MMADNLRTVISTYRKPVSKNISEMLRETHKDTPAVVRAKHKITEDSTNNKNNSDVCPGNMNQRFGTSSR